MYIQELQYIHVEGAIMYKIYYRQYTELNFKKMLPSIIFPSKQEVLYT